MFTSSLPLNNPYVEGLLWSTLTVGLYLAVKRVYLRRRQWWLTPLLMTPILLSFFILAFHVPYKEYLHGTHWLLVLLGPATVAFAAPIYEHRALIRRNWTLLAIGMVAGSATAIATSWVFATLLGIDGALRLSLLPRSISTPFAMEVSNSIGGVSDLTAVFVVLTGVLGAVLGQCLAGWLPLRSALSRGALFGMGAHAAGTAKAHEMGQEEGSIAGLVMVLVGLFHVLGASLLASVL